MNSVNIFAQTINRRPEFVGSDKKICSSTTRCIVFPLNYLRPSLPILANDAKFDIGHERAFCFLCREMF